MKPLSSICLIVTAAGLIGSASAADRTAPIAVTRSPAKAGDGVQVGVATRDGVTVSGGVAYVTRNGATEKLTKELILPSGITVQPNGTAILADHSQVSLTATQLLTLDGKIIELPPNPNVNPGDPRGNGTASREVVPATSGGAATPGFSAGTTSGSGPSLARNNGAGSDTVFLGGDGLPFMGSINANGTITRADGSILPFDRSLRPVTFGTNGTPALGLLNANGTITRSDGATIALDGSIRAADGTIISPPARANAGASTNANTSVNGDNTATTNTQQGIGGTQQGGATQQGVGGTQQGVGGTQQGVGGTQQGVGGTQQITLGSGRNTNSPNNTGTVNTGNTTPNAANSPNNTGTVNNGNSGGTVNENTEGGNANAANGGTSGTSNATGGSHSTGTRGTSGGGSARSSGGGSVGGAAGGAAGAKK